MAIDNLKLREYFPMLRTRAEVLENIQGSPELQRKFELMPKDHREAFLDFVTGVRGTKVTYDFMFRQVMDPEAVPSRMESFLSELLKRRVRIVAKIGGKEQFADEMSLLETDVVVRFEDGSIADVEIQKIGYAFPGERSACYSADLLLRQYKRAREKSREEKREFSYRDLKPVYTIVLLEKSSREFHVYPDQYVHHFRYVSDTGLSLRLLQEHYFIPLDIFSRAYENKGIQTKVDAWLTFFSQDSPEAVMDLISRYPEFEEYYGHIYDICQNVEDAMGLFSEELRIMDRNTVKIMLDELMEESEKQRRRAYEARDVERLGVFAHVYA